MYLDVKGIECACVPTFFSDLNMSHHSLTEQKRTTSLAYRCKCINDRLLHGTTFFRSCIMGMSLTVLWWTTQRLHSSPLMFPWKQQVVGCHFTSVLLVDIMMVINVTHERDYNFKLKWKICGHKIPLQTPQLSVHLLTLCLWSWCGTGRVQCSGEWGRLPPPHLPPKH